MIERPELFLIDDDLYCACDDHWDEIDATYTDMEELGIAKLPYDNVDISMPCHYDEPNDAMGPGGNLEIYFRFRDGKYTSAEVRIPKYVMDRSGPLPGEQTIGETLERLRSERRRHQDTILPANEDFQRDASMEWANDTKRLLIVLLASKGIIKERNKNKLAALGIGRDKRA